MVGRVALPTSGDPAYPHRVDLLDHLLADPNADARQRLRSALSGIEPDRVMDEVVFNVYEVTLNFEVGEARVFDALDGNAEPTVVTLDELRTRVD